MYNTKANALLTTKLMKEGLHEKNLNPHAGNSAGERAHSGWLRGADTVTYADTEAITKPVTVTFPFAVSKSIADTQTDDSSPGDKDYLDGTELR